MVLVIAAFHIASGYSLMNRSVSDGAESSGFLTELFHRDYYGQMAVAHGLLGQDDLARSYRHKVGTAPSTISPDLINAIINACDFYDSGAEDGTDSVVDLTIPARLEALAIDWPDAAATAAITALACQLTNFAGPDKAEAMVRRLATRLPADACVQHALAYVLLFSGRFEAGRSSAAAAAALAPKDAIPWILLGNCELCLGHPAEAEQAFTTALSLAPRSEQAYGNLGILCIADGRFERAEQYLDEAIRLAPPYDYLLSWKSALRLRQGRLDEALTLADAAADICTLNVWTFSNRALCLLAMNDIDGAVADQIKARRYPHLLTYNNHLRPWAARALTLLTAAASGDEAAKHLLWTTPCFP